MSAYINTENSFTKIYGNAFISSIRNKYDLEPLIQRIKKNNPDSIIFVNKLHVRIFEIFSQTMFLINADRCKFIEKLVEKNVVSVEKYKQIPPNIFKNITKKSYKILKHLPTNLILIPTKLDLLNEKIIIRFKLHPEHDKIFTEIVSILNKLYGTNRKKPCFFVIGYTTNKDNFKFSPDVNDLIPSRIQINFPKFCQYRNMGSYFEIDNFS